MLDLGTLRIKIKADADEAKSKIQGLASETSNAESITSKAGDAISNVWGKVKVAVAAAGAAVTASVAAIGKAALDNYASYEQLTGGVETLFKDSASIVEEYAANAYTTAGLSANDYMETVTSFSASLLQSLDNDTQAAAEKADLAITDMSDNANKMGTSMESIQNAYQGFAKQNYTMLDNLKLGYGGTKEEMQRLIDDANELNAAQGKLTDYSIDSYADIVDAIHDVQTEMGITGTTYEEAATTIEGSINSAKAAWTNWLTGLGDTQADMGELTNNLVQSVITAADNIVPRLGIIILSLVDALKQQLPGVISSLGTEIQDLITNLLYDVDLASALPDGVVDSLFDGAIGDIDTKLFEMADAVKGAFDGVVSTFVNLVATLTPLIQPILNLLSSIGSYISANFSKLGEVFNNTILPAISNVVPKVGELINALAGLLPIVQPIVSVFISIAGVIGSVLINAFGLVVSVVTTVIEWFTNFVNTIISIPDTVSNFVNSISEWFNQLPGIIATAVASMIASIVSWAANIVSQATSAGSGFANAVKSKFNEVVSFVSSIPSRIVSALGDLGSLLLSAGRNLMQGLANGITQGLTNAINTARNAASDIASAVKGFFGIASPSKLFKEYGDYLDQGLAIGIKDNASKPLKAMSAMANQISGAFNAQPQLATASAATGTVYNFNVNGINVASATDESSIAQIITSELLNLQRLARI